MTTDEVCLVCKKGNKDTFKHLAHAHLTCVMTEIQKAHQDEHDKVHLHGVCKKCQQHLKEARQDEARNVFFDIEHLIDERKWEEYKRMLDKYFPKEG